MGTKMIEEIILKVSVDSKDTAPQIDKVDKATSGLNVNMKAMGIAALATSGYLSLKLAKSAYETALRFDTMRNSIFGMTGDLTKSDLIINSSILTANKYGQSIESIAMLNAKLQATFRGTTLEGAKTKDIFEGIVTAGTALGMSTEKQSQLVDIFQKMTSEGTVKMEAFAGEMGKSIPGAMKIAADSMGLTIAQFREMLTKGEIVTSDFLPKYSKALNEHFSEGAKKAANGNQASLNKIKNDIDLILNDIGGFFLNQTPAIAKFTTAVRDSIVAVQETAQGVSLWLDELQGLNKTDVGISDEQKEQWKAEKKAKEEQIKLEKELAKAEKERKDFEKSLEQSSGFREIADSFLLEDKLKTIREELKLTDAEFDTFKGAMATALKEGMSIEDAKEWTKILTDDLKDKINTVTEEMKESPLRNMINDAMKLKASLDFSKELGLSKEELEKMGSSLTQLMNSDATTEEIKAGIKKLRELGYFNDDKDPLKDKSKKDKSNKHSSPIGSTFQVGTKEASAFLQANKLDEDRNATLKEINRAVQKTAENGMVQVVVKGNGV